MRQCTCGKTTQPPVHLLCDRVDVLDSNSQHKMAAHAVDCRFGMPVEKTGRNHLSGDETLQELKSSGTFEVDKRCGQEIQGSTRMDETKSFDLQWLFGECFDESSTRQGDDGSAEHCDDDPFTGVVPSLSTAVVNIGENPALKNACRPVSVAEEARSLSTNSSTVQKSDSGDPSTADGIRVSARIHGSSRGERLGAGDDRVCSKGLGRSRYSRKPHEPPHIIQGGGRQRKQFGVSPVDREREKKERQVRKPRKERDVKVAESLCRRLMDVQDVRHCKGWVKWKTLFTNMLTRSSSRETTVWSNMRFIRGHIYAENLSTGGEMKSSHATSQILRLFLLYAKRKIS